MSYYSQPMMPMGGMGPMSMPMGSMAGSAYGTPYGGNALMMNGMGSEYGAPFVDGYPPTIARTHSLYGDDRDLYDRERGYYDRGYGRDYYDDDYDYDRGRRYSSGYSRRRGRSYSRSSRYYDDPYDYDYGRGYGDYYDRDYYDRYSSRYGGGYYSGSSRYYGSSSGRKREELSVIKKDNGDIKVLRDGQERLSDKFRRMFGLDPKGMNIVRVKRGEQLAAHISR